MTGIQVTYIKLEDYGPWTLGLGHDREHQIQGLQAEVYRFLQGEFSGRGGLVFTIRFDEYVAVSNGIDAGEHRDILEAFSKRFPLGVSMGVGVAGGPLEALKRAEGALLASLRRGERLSVSPPDMAEGRELSVTLAHADIKGSSRMTAGDGAGLLEFSFLMLKVYTALIERSMERGLLGFYLGGDNFLVIDNDRDTGRIMDVLASSIGASGLEYRCGIGRAATARRAMELATRALDAIRRGSVGRDHYYIEE